MKFLHIILPSKRMMGTYIEMIRKYYPVNEHAFYIIGNMAKSEESLFQYQNVIKLNKGKNIIEKTKNLYNDFSKYDVLIWHGLVVSPKIALFLLAHADKVMDTVAPLEALRDELAKVYTTKVQEKLDDPELTPGQLARIISDIQSMNIYSMTALKNILDADKLQAIIATDASSNVENMTVNILNLPDAASRSRVARALDQISRLNLSSDMPEESSDN